METVRNHGDAGLDADELDRFDQDGYLLCRDVLAPDELAEVRTEFDHLWDAHAAGGRVYHQQLLTSPVFVRLACHPAITGRHRSLFGGQTQLLSMDLLRQGPRSAAPQYGWHRDFHFPGDHPLAANTILYLDDIGDEQGPTKVVPGTHRGRNGPPPNGCSGPLPGQVEIHARAGDATIINAAVWHTGSRNRSDGLRRAVYLYYGWWWLKQYFAERGPIPWQAADGADPEQLALLGFRMPGRDLHMY